MPPKKKPQKTTKKAKPTIRAGMTVVEVFNSGLEVWLYDEANREALRAGGAFGKMMEGDEGPIKALYAQGELAGYSMDDGLRVGVIVRPALTPEELAVCPWLEPQTAFLRLPGGRLCLESN